MADLDLSRLQKIQRINGEEYIIITNAETRTENGRYPLSKLKEELVIQGIAEFNGIATPQTEVPTIDGYWVVTDAGKYPNFGGVELPTSSIGFIVKKGNEFIISYVGIEGDYFKKTEKIPNENLNFGEVKEGDSNVVSGGDVFESNKKIESDVIEKTQNKPIKNILINSNFSNQNEIAIWAQSFSGATVSIDNGNLLIKGNGANENPSTAGGSVTPLIAGHKYYFKVVLKTNKPTSQFRCFVRGLTQTSSNGFIEKNPNVNEYYNLGKIITASSSPTTYGVAIGARFESPEEANGSVITVKNTMLIDLTLAYGAGNEPSLTDFEKIIGEIDNKWFDGSYDTYPNGKIISEIQEIKSSIVSSRIMTNKFNNSEMDSKTFWRRGSGVSQSYVEFNTDENYVRLIPTDDNSRKWGVFEQEIDRPKKGDKLFFYFETREIGVKPSSSNIYIRGGATTTDYSGNMTDTRGLNEWGPSYRIIEMPNEPTSNVWLSVRTNYPNSTEDLSGAFQDFRKPIYVNLTEIFGKGNEPKVEFMVQYINNLKNKHFNNSIAFTDGLFPKIKKYTLDIDTVSFNSSDAIKYDKGISPVLFGVKNRNARDKQTQPYGWLYYVPFGDYEVLYSAGTPYSPKKIFNWDFDIVNGETPDKYSPIICKNGDIIFVFRGERSVEEPRRNPIIYKFEGDYSTPQVIDFEDRFKPHAWLQNCGMEYIYDEDIILFAEYTRPQSVTANIWKVTQPFENPDNWKVVKSFDIGSEVGQIEHLHTVNYDPYNGYIYSTSGDWDSQSNILESRDNGATWEIARSGEAMVSRVLNFILLPTGAYYATDDARHVLYHIKRLENGALDWENEKILYNFRFRGLAGVTYATCLIEEPRGLLILDRHDAEITDNLLVHFYDLNTDIMHVISELKPLEGKPNRLGFRNDAVSFYPNLSFDGVAVGFGFHRNYIDILGNELENKEKSLNNLVLKVMEVR